jgi:hypothetical protein
MWLGQFMGFSMYVVLVHHGRKLDVCIQFQVPGLFIQLALDQICGPHMVVAVPGLQVSNVLFHAVAKRLALGEEERNARTDIR